MTSGSISTSSPPSRTISEAIPLDMVRFGTWVELKCGFETIQQPVLLF